MEQMNVYYKGVRDYSKISGPTGPLVCVQTRARRVANRITYANTGTPPAMF